MKPSGWLAAAALLAGCACGGPDAQVHSVQYYQQHLEEARKAYRPGDCGGENYFPVPETNRRRNCENAMLALYVQPAAVQVRPAAVVVHSAPAPVAAGAAASDPPH